MELGMTSRSKSIAKKFGLGSRKKKSDIGPPPPCSLNGDFPRRLEKFRDRKIIEERGIARDELHDTEIPRVVEEFYVGIVPNDFRNHSPVMVHRREVSITHVEINRYFRTERPANVVENSLNGGIAQHRLHTRQNVDLTNSLVIQPMTFWVAPSYLLQHTNLKIELGLCHIFVTHSLRPWDHRTSVAFEVAIILHCIQSGSYIDVGYLAHSDILIVGGKEKESQLLMFPCLINEFCKRVGVDFGDDPIDSHQSDIGFLTWNTLQIKRDPTSRRRKTGRRKNRNATGLNRAEHDPKGKGPMVDDAAESSDEE
ncbi:hypothetical protein Dsin_001429 [Dipteronia sinensis]|uniref:Putative plant transposon protein domain-containing protein n=1 Tax=Dipteronia sinensis TaxID=43782 RepID=A0AAE0B4R5_9ROSI|nr:hypothetical protein Dsin_001429 [Dipteronia sinensis]